MNTNTLEKPPFNSLPDAAKDAAQRATEAAKQVTQQATDAARNCCESVSTKVDETVVRAQDYVKKNPMAIVLGAVAFGVAVGCIVALSTRHRPTLRERFVDDPVQTTRDTLYAALAPVAQRLHEGYDTARDGAGKVMNGLHRSTDSWADQLGRVGNNLKFW
jgi:ElaB/YqjD/DUF883 family membrane-anchored ribosome-binding protein